MQLQYSIALVLLCNREVENLGTEIPNEDKKTNELQELYRKTIKRRESLQDEYQVAERKFKDEEDKVRDQV